MEYIKKETQDCVEIMNQICDKITKLLEIDSLVRATNDSNTKNSEKGFHNVIQQLLSKIARLLNL